MMFPGGSPELVEPIYKNEMLSAPFNEQLAAALRAFILNRLEVTHGRPHQNCTVNMHSGRFSL